MIKGYSTCHFAEAMPETNSASSFMARCSFCGKSCTIVKAPYTTVSYDVELTLRRWKENDCSTEDMLKRIVTEYGRIFSDVFDEGARSLQSNAEPKYRPEYDRKQWVSTTNPEDIVRLP